MTQLVRLYVQQDSDSLCKFEYDPHSTGRLILQNSYTVSGTSCLLDTGVKFMLVSSDSEVISPGYYYTVVPYLNPSLKAYTIEQGQTVELPDPLVNVIAYPTGRQGKEMYTLKEASDKPTLSLKLLPRHGFSGELLRGSTLCFLTFPVGFDLLNKETCFELT